MKMFLVGTVRSSRTTRLTCHPPVGEKQEFEFTHATGAPTLRRSMPNDGPEFVRAQPCELVVACTQAEEIREAGARAGAIVRILEKG